VIRYFDASALVKLYIRETGSAAVRRLLDEFAPATCRLTEVEIASALARRRREGDLNERAYNAALTMLQVDMTRLHVVELAPPTIALVHSIFRRHPLRAGDALHLTAAMTLRDGIGSPIDFICFDDRLGSAARAEGFRLLP
jgi:predicted nucleic acid-binding protein